MQQQQQQQRDRPDSHRELRYDDDRRHGENHSRDRGDHRHSGGYRDSHYDRYERDMRDSSRRRSDSRERDYRDRDHKDSRGHEQSRYSR